MTWPKEDQIRFVEYRLREQKKPRRHRKSVPDTQDLEIWLAKVRDDRTWGQIARQFFPNICQPRPGKRPYTGERWASNPAIGRARSAHKRVEKYFNPTEQETLRELIEEQKQRQGIGDLPVELLYDCSPDYFEEHFLRRSRQHKCTQPMDEKQETERR